MVSVRFGISDTLQLMWRHLKGGQDGRTSSCWPMRREVALGGGSTNLYFICNSIDIIVIYQELAIIMRIHIDWDRSRILAVRDKVMFS